MTLLWIYGILILLFTFSCVNTVKIPYDSFTGVRISRAEYLEHLKRNNTQYCVIEIEPCDENEGRRADGSCNNLKYPSRGPSKTPHYRILPAAYDTAGGGYQICKMGDGKPFPPTRNLRTSFFPEGKVSDPIFTQLVTNFLAFSMTDVTSVQDTEEYVLGRSLCCRPNGNSDPACVNNYIPDDDPVFRYSSQRCINMTIPSTFQAKGCLKSNTLPEMMLLTTSELDLSNLYDTPESLKTNRYYENGLLKYEVENGKIWPPKENTEKHCCLANKKPRETRCHTHTVRLANSLIGINLNIIWFWRNHNRIALALSELNPCWDDDMIFDTARDINTATMTQILYYELYPLLMGKSNLLRDGVISADPGFRDLYNEAIYPQIALEYRYGCRWFHGMQEGSLHMYDQEGNYLKEIPIVELTSRTGYLAIDNNIDYITQGSFRQGCAKGDNIVDPDMANRAFGYLQKALDVFTNDWAKGRYFGIQPYVAYRKRFFGKSYKTFDDLEDVFAPEYLDKLKENYKHPKEIEFMPGIWLEKKVKGGHIPETLYCIIVEQLKRFLASDRHWYERPNRPNAFTEYQLQEIRKASVSRLLCDVGDKVTKIQPSAFLRPGPGNQITDCHKLPRIDLSAWEDESCTTDCYYY